MRRLILAWAIIFALGNTAVTAQTDTFEIDTEAGLKTFLEQIVLEGLPGPAGDVISALQMSPDILRTGMSLWLRKKMSEEVYAGNVDNFDAYLTLYTCMARRVCGDIRTLPAGKPTFASTPSKAVDRFYITQVFVPATVKSGDGKGNLTVFWVGNPVFPVTMIYRPARNGCEPDMNCSSPEMVFSSDKDPLIFPESVWCAGVSRNLHFGYEVLLRDSTGRETAPAPAEFSCLRTGR